MAADPCVMPLDVLKLGKAGFENKVLNFFLILEPIIISENKFQHIILPSNAINKLKSICPPQV